MIRDKSNITSLGLDSEGTQRCVLSKPIVSEDPLQWPRYCKAQVQEFGRDFRLVATAEHTLTIRGIASLLLSGNLTWAVQPGDTIDVFNAGGANGSYTVVSAAHNNSANPKTTTITVVETVPAATITSDSVASTDAIHWPPWLTSPIVSHTHGANADVVLDMPALPVDSPICLCDMFLDFDLALITGSYHGLNDGLQTCRADFTDSGGARTIHLNGYLTELPPGEALGAVTLVLPRPRRLWTGRFVRATMGNYRTQAGANWLAQVRDMDSANGFREITSLDVGPYVAPLPE